MPDHFCQVATGPLDADVTPPGSKSITNRALIAAALADGVSFLQNISPGDDARLMIAALRALGVVITVDEVDRAVEVTGCRGLISAFEAELYCGNSGTTLRFCAALAALGHGVYRLDGVERMHERPAGALVTALRALGAGVECPEREGFPPLVVHARGLDGGTVRMEAPESSQLVSALLLAGPYAAHDLMIEVGGPVDSVPYLKMTALVMSHFGGSVIEQYDGRAGARFIVPGGQRYQGATMRIEPDASSASYFLAAAAVAGGCVRVHGVGTASIQGDARFVDVLERMGCAVERGANCLAVRRERGVVLHGIDVDLNEMPDVVPTLAVTALFADGPTTIRNVGNLRAKESDRLAALARELRKLGSGVNERADGLTIHPSKDLTAARLATHGDHRLAMSFALAGLRVPGVAIESAEVSDKTHPEFFDAWAKMLV